jgi:hypothetical protein
VDRRHELEQEIRSLAMLPPQAPALDREHAIRLLGELRDVQARLGRLRDGLRRLVEEADGEGSAYR